MGTVCTDTVDRISELPDIILHDILSALDTKEACRASVLSKRWYAAWSFVPVLDFQIQYFKENREFSLEDLDDNYECSDSFYDDVTVARFVKYVDKTLRRYSEQKFRIRKLILTIHKVNEALKSFVDRWLRIAVESQIRELDIRILLDYSPAYQLPEVLFRAKSLNVLKCDNVYLPYYETMELISLECLTLLEVFVHGYFFQRIVSSCPLVDLNFKIICLEQISLPGKRKVKKRVKCFDSGTVQSNFEESPLTKFVYNGGGICLPWPWKMDVGALKNLRKLEIVDAYVTDNTVFKLAYGLIALESLVLNSCFMLKCLNISSVSLKKLEISLAGLKSGTINTPNMLEFTYNCEVETSLVLLNVHDNCIGLFQPLMEYINAGWFVKLKNVIVKARVFKCLALDLSGFPQTMVEGDAWRKFFSGSPYKLTELKLLGTATWDLTESFLVAVLDGLFWSCNPDVLSIRAGLHTSTVKEILNILKRKVQCWEHPLRSIKVEGVDCSSLLSESSEMEIRCRLSWASVSS